MTEKFNGYLERTPALTILGGFLTNYYNGLILIIFVTFVTFSLLVNVGINLSTLLFTILFAFPVFLFAHFRLVLRGRKSMKKNWKLEVNKDEKVLQYESGYPNIVKPKLVKLDLDDISKILLKGNETFGYFLEFETTPFLKAMKEAKTPKDRLKIERTQLGLWRKKGEAYSFGEKLSRIIEKPFEEKTRDKTLKTNEDDSD